MGFFFLSFFFFLLTHSHLCVLLYNIVRLTVTAVFMMLETLWVLALVSDIIYTSYKAADAGAEAADSTADRVKITE